MMQKRLFKYFNLFLYIALFSALVFVVRAIGRQTVATNDCALDKMECCIVNVGDGNCAVLKCGSKTIMIDIGPSESKEHVKDILEQMDVTAIDCLIISHPHSDHYGGFKALKDIPVKIVYISPQESEKSYYAECLEFFSQRGASPIQTPVGEFIEIGEIKLFFLGPLEQNKSVNDMSLVIRAVYKDISVLFPADMSGEEARQIIDSGCVLSSEVFICAHHGSNADGANSYVLLREVMPEYVIISGAGSQSMYGYPHEEVLSRLRDLGCEVYRTDLFGDISFYTYGEKIYFN